MPICISVCATGCVLVCIDSGEEEATCEVTGKVSSLGTGTGSDADSDISGTTVFCSFTPVYKD